MRHRAILLVLLASAALASAQRRLTIAQLKDLLASTTKQSEDGIAGQLTSIELTERMSAATFAHLQNRFIGSRGRLALLALADASAFHDLPLSELPNAPPPDAATQTQILSLASEYVRTLRPRLPNFSALRTTTLFEATTQAQMASEERAYQLEELTTQRLGYRSLGSAGPRGTDLFLVGTTDSRVTYNDGSEVQGAASAPRKGAHLLPRSLSTSGEFGPILSIVDHDAMHGNIAWHNWEQGPKGVLAVFRFKVPRDQSHFAIYSTDPRFPGFPPGEDRPAYHGEVAVDPADGSVYRIEILSDPDDSGDPILASGVVVEYGQVEIGAKTYVCPLHGIAVSAMHDSDNPRGAHGTPSLRRFVNDVSFTQYHLFRSEYRIIP